MKKYQSKQTFYPLLYTGSTQVDPSRQDRKIVDSDVKNLTKQIKTSKQTNKSNAQDYRLPCQAELSLIHVKSLQNTLSHNNRINPPHAPICIAQGAQWLSGRVLDSRPRDRRFEPHRRHCVVVLEQDTFILA